MDTRLLDVLHDPADETVTGDIAARVDVDFDRVFEEAVDECRSFRGQTAFSAERTGGRELPHRRGGGRSSS